MSFLDAKSVAGSSSGGCCSMDVPCDIMQWCTTPIPCSQLPQLQMQLGAERPNKGPTNSFLQCSRLFPHSAPGHWLLPSSALSGQSCLLLEMEPTCIFLCCTLVSVLLGNKASTLFLSACFTTNERNLKNP